MDSKQELQQKRKELSSFISTLGGINKEKEEAYKQLQEMRKQLKVKTDKVRDLKKKRDELTKEVRQLKQKRDNLNVAVKKSSTMRKDVDERKRELTKGMDQESPGKLRSIIAGMEEKLETEVMAFNKEEQMRKSLKELIIRLKKITAVSSKLKELGEVSGDFSENRKKAQESHQAVQKIAQESQDIHLAINGFYKDIKDMRKEEKVVAKKYLELKVKYQNTKIDIDGLNKEVKALSDDLEEVSKKSFKSQVAEKTAEVKEKMKKGKKLSTEDILAFQASSD
jgi:uncharacterized coiled-coil DUF342 family protein